MAMCSARRVNPLFSLKEGFYIDNLISHLINFTLLMRYTNILITRHHEDQRALVSFRKSSLKKYADESSIRVRSYVNDVIARFVQKM